MRPRDLVQANLPKHYLAKLIEDGEVIRLSRGLYQLSEQSVSQWQSYIEVQRQVPKGVICLLSALVFHGMTTQNPYEIWVSIDRKDWRPKIAYPPVRYFTVSGDALSKGVETHVLDGIAVKIFTPAKTVADCFKYRNKVGLDIAVEALKDGWKAKKFNMQELMEMAKICRVEQVMKPYVNSIAHS